MIDIDEAYDIVVGLNESAHQQSWDTWAEADDLDNSDDESDWETAEELREQASQEQAGYFREEFEQLEDDIKDAILHYVDTDQSFREEFVVWYGEEDFEADFG